MHTAHSELILVPLLFFPLSLSPLWDSGSQSGESGVLKYCFKAACSLFGLKLTETFQCRLD